MIDALAAGLAGQLALAALAKARSPRDGGQTLLGTLWPRVPASIFVAGDVIVAALLLWPGTTRLAAALAVIAIAGFEALAIAYRDRGVTSCGCFGTAPIRGDLVWRERTTKAVMVAEAVGAFFTLGARVPAILQVGGALVLTAAVIALTPELAGGWRRLRPLTGREALRTLAKDPDYLQWRPLLLNPRPAEVRHVGRSVRIVLDAWSQDRPVVLVAMVTRSRVRLRAHDAATMAALG